MFISRIGIAVLAGATMLGCASIQIAPSPSAATSAELERGFRRQQGPAEVQFTLDGAPDQVTPRVTSAFTHESLSVTSSKPGLIDARLPPDNNVGVTYQVVAHAMITPTGAGLTQVILYGERTVTSVTTDPLDVQRIDGGMYGRSGATWVSLLKIAAALQPDSARRVVVLPP